MQKKMRTAVFRKKGSVELTEIERPRIRGDQVLIKMETCAICTWDQRVYTGLNVVNYPFVGGHEMFATVEQIGDEVNTEKLKVGDSVAVGLLATCGSCHYCNMGQHNLCSNFDYNKKVGGLPYSGTGGFSEYLAVSPKYLFKAHAGLKKELGAFTEPLSCVNRSVEYAGLTTTQTAVVIGAGTMGILHLLLLKSKGIEVIVSEPDESKRRMASKLGAMDVINPLKEDPIKRLQDFTDNRGAEGVFITSASPEAAEQVVRMAAPLGTVVIYSSIYPKDMIRLDPNWVHKTMVKITGSANSNQQDFEKSIKMLSNGLIDPSPLVSFTFPFEKIDEAIRHTLDQKKYRTILTFPS